MYTYVSSRVLILNSFLFLALIPNHIAAQEELIDSTAPVIHESGEWILSISANSVHHPAAQRRFAGGLDAIFFLSKYVSLNANFAIGHEYLQLGMGLISLPLLLARGPRFLAESELERILIGIALVALTFENLNFHIPIASQSEISPYFSLLRIKYIKEGYGGNGHNSNVNFVIGTRLNIFIAYRIYIAPYAEATRDWNRNGLWGVNAGLNLGLIFQGR